MALGPLLGEPLSLSLHAHDYGPAACEAVGRLEDVRGVEVASGSLDAVSDVFVGRQGELALLASCVESVRGGSLNVALIEGAAGIGKTALLRAFLQDRRGLRVLWASGDEAESSLPFGVVDQLLSAAGTSQAETRVARGVPDGVAVGARLVEVFGGLQARCPLVVVVDDAHWADRPSLTSLTFALRRLRTDRILALVTLREGSLPELPDGLQRLSLDSQPSAVFLTGLPTTDVRELAAAVGNSRPSLAMADRLREHTGGNPLHVRALLAELPGGWSLATEASLPCPRSYSLLVLHRLASCPQPAQELVVAGAVLGVRCTLADAARLAAVEEPLAALEAAVAADLLEVSEAHGADVAFTHPLVRAAVYNDLGPARRAALHACAATIVGEYAGALRHRVAATVGEDQALARELAVHARDEAARGSLTGAARTMLAAARVAGAHERETLLLEGVELLVMSGDMAAAGMATAVEATAKGPRRHYVLGLLALQGGRWVQAEALLADAWRTCPTREPELGARIAGELARLSCLQCRGEDAAAWALRAATHHDAGSPPPGILYLALGLGMSGRTEEGLECLGDLPEALHALHPAALEGLVGRGMLRLWSDDLIGARRDLSRSAGVARARGPAHLWMLALGQLAEVEYRAGDWDAAVTHSQAAVSAAADAEQVWLLPYLHTLATAPLVARGQWNQAAAQVRGAMETARSLAVTSATCCAAIAEATLCLGQGHHQAAVDALEPLRSLHEQGIAHHPGTMPWAEINVEALLALGCLDEAEALLRDFDTLMANGGRRSTMIDAARLRGLLLAARGRTQAAEAAFRHGLAQGSEVAFPFHQARLESALGQHLMRAGKRKGATDLLRLAHERFRQLGALPHLRSCERELLARGSGPGRRAALKGAALTPQELAVATLVCSGDTNRQVAAELVLSVKTIEFHLGNAYAKLGVGSRTQLCTKLVTTGMVQADEPHTG